METLIIGKPAINEYLPLQEFPQEGDIFTIKVKNESVGNVGASSACLLAKWGISTHFTGVVGNDSYAEKIKNTFKEYRVDAKYMETNFENATSVNYIILNSKTGNSSKILYNNPDVQLTKYKYDFLPEFAIIDGTDFAGAHALLNNNNSCKTVFYARIADKDTINISKKCTWVVCTQTFAENMTKIETDGTASSYVNLYQKIVDLSGKSNYIVILNNHKILYSVDGKVKMLPEMKINIVDSSSFDSIFVGAFSYGIGNSINIDDAIKLANTAAGLSISKIGEVTSIPTLDEVLDNSGLREKVKSSASTSETPATPVAPLNPGVQENAVETPTTPEPVNTTEVEDNNNVNVAFGAQPTVSDPASPVPRQAPAVSSQIPQQSVEMPVQMEIPNSNQSITQPSPSVQTLPPENNQQYQQPIPSEQPIAQALSQAANETVISTPMSENVAIHPSVQGTEGANPNAASADQNV